MATYKDIGTAVTDRVGMIEIRKPPNNFFDVALIHQIADAAEAFDADPEIRAVLLCADGKAFCAGADFSSSPDTGLVTEEGGKITKHLYKEAIRLFRTKKPIVAAIHGPAIGGGLGLALVADFRITCPEARFSANFTRLGFHPGFGLTATLPRLVGQQKAAMIFYTGRRLNGDEATAIGLADQLVLQSEVRSTAQALAAEIAEAGRDPLAEEEVPEAVGKNARGEPADAV